MAPLQALLSQLGRLPAGARASALSDLLASAHQLRAQANALPAAGPVRITDMQWASAVEDADLAGLVSSLDERLNQLAAEQLSGGDPLGTLRNALRPLVHTVGQLLENVEALMWFGPAGRQARAQQTPVSRLANELAAYLAELTAELAAPQPRLPIPPGSPLAACDALRQATLPLRRVAQPDPVELNFGISQRELTDSRGVQQAGRLAASFSGRENELDAACERVLRPLMRASADRAGLRYALSLPAVERPWRAYRAAFLCKQLIEARFKADPAHTVAVLRAHKLDAERGAASHRGIIASAQRRGAAREDGERVMADLDVYRRLAEGWLRPWGWLVAQLHGRRGDRAPEVSNLAGMLRRLNDALCELISDGLDVELRNAAAHEDAHYDPYRQQVVAGPLTLDLARIEAATTRAYATAVGCEAALAFARTDQAQLRAMVDGGTIMPAAMRELYAREAFGRAGFLVADAWKDGDEHVVELERLDDPEARLRALLFALMESFLQDGTGSRWTVRTRENEQPLLSVGADALAASARLGHRMVGRWGEPLVPAAVLYPVLASAKAAAYGPAAAADQIAELALSDVLRPAFEGAAGAPDTASAVEKAAQAAAMGLSTALELLGRGSQHADLTEQLEQLGNWSARLGEGDPQAAGELARRGQALLDRYHQLPHAPLLPGMSRPA